LEDLCGEAFQTWEGLNWGEITSRLSGQGEAGMPGLKPRRFCQVRIKREEKGRENKVEMSGFLIGKAEVTVGSNKGH